MPALTDTNQADTLLDDFQEITQYVAEVTEHATKRRQLERESASCASSTQSVQPSLSGGGLLWRVKCQVCVLGRFLNPPLTG